MGGFVLLRLRAHRLLVTAALLTMVLTVGLLSALVGFSSSIDNAGVQRALQSTDATQATLNVSAQPAAGTAAAVDRSVRRYAAQAFGGLPVDVRSSTVSDTFGLPWASTAAATLAARTGGNPDLTMLATLDRSKLTLLHGSWPGKAATGQPVPVAVPVAAASRLPAVGGLLTIQDRDSQRELRIRVVGVYAPTNSADPYWQLDTLGGSGIQRVGFSTYGPLLIDAGDFTSGAVPAQTVAWVATADFAGIDLSRADALPDTVNEAIAAIIADGSLGSQTTATSGLPALLPSVDQAVAVSRSSLLVGAVQLALLALFAILLVSRLINDAHTGETALLQARGAAPRRLAALGAAEALLLTLPALVAAVLLAGPLIGLLAAHGPTATAGVRIGALPLGPVLLTAAVGSLGCLLFLLQPSLRRSALSARTPGASRTGTRLLRRIPAGLLRTGGDLVLLGLAAVAYWQLRNDNGTGSTGIDPFLVAAPTLALCAGATLAMRLLPPLAGIAERIAARGSALSGALAGWQLARRPQQIGAPVMLLVLAVAMGTLAVGQNSSINRSQSDRATFTVPADVTVTGAGSPGFGQGAAYAALPGVTGAVPVIREPLPSLGQNQGAAPGLLLATDTRAESSEFPLRSDLAGTSVRRLLAPLAPAAEPVSELGIPIPGRPRYLELDVSDSDFAGVAAQDSLVVTVTDRFGVPYQFTALPIDADGRTHTLRLDLDAAAGAPLGLPAYPLTISQLSFSYSIPSQITDQQLLALLGVRAIRADGTALALPPGLAWQAKVSDSAPSGTAGLTDASVGRETGGGIASVTARAATNYFSGVINQGTVDLTPAGGSALPPSLPAVVTTGFLQQTGATVGQTVGLSTGMPSLRIVAAVPELPGTTAADGGVALVDLTAYERWLTAQQQPGQPATDWWLSVSPDTPQAQARVAAALRARADDPTVQVRDEVLAGLRNDPFSAGPQTALLALAIVAALLAAVGFTVSAVGAVRRRANESALLFAIGATRRELARSTAVELGVPVLLSLAVGLPVGALLTRIVVPLLVLTSTGTRPVPPVLVQLPLPQLGLLVAAVALVPLVVAGLAGRLGGPATTATLRSKEEQ
ncbi:FtsX-like permease family protein [Streptacidiphilus albus]|uniref:FtsX-like permease family protein n=1 Tax=Streptacidiphilus albus TaxID=105425 RepID=UPI00054C212A|nr:FtsX-like permease family protein [Streptacidiphilus albus]